MRLRAPLRVEQQQQRYEVVKMSWMRLRALLSMEEEEEPAILFSHVADNPFDMSVPIP